MYHAEVKEAERPQGSFQGCFKDDGHRDLKHGRSARTQAQCSEQCKGFKFYAMQAGGECRCDNNYGTAPQYSKVDDRECGHACHHETINVNPKYCGAGWRNAVYRVTEVLASALYRTPF